MDGRDQYLISASALEDGPRMAGVCVEWVEWGPPSTMEARNFDGLSCSLGAHEQAAQPGIVPVRPSPTIAHLRTESWWWRNGRTEEYSTSCLRDVQIRQFITREWPWVGCPMFRAGDTFLLHDGGACWGELPTA